VLMESASARMMQLLKSVLCQVFRILACAEDCKVGDGFKASKMAKAAQSTGREGG
jgi:hypothetical protein